MTSVVQRYLTDARFKRLVDMLEHEIAACEYTPTEMREAAVLASQHHEMRKPPGAIRVLHVSGLPVRVVVDPTIPPDTIELRTSSDRVRIEGLKP